MKRVSKLIALALSLVMALSLAACSGGNAAGSSAGSAGNDSAEPKTLDVWLPATAADGNDAELWADIIDEWEAENNATVNFQFISWKDYEAKYTSGISTGTGPDVGYMYVEMFPTFIDAGAVEDIAPYLTQEDYDNYTVLDERYQIFGKNYGVATAGMSGCVGLVVNMDILNELGEEMPQNWDDVTRIAQKATLDTDNDGKIDQYGLAQGWGQTFYQDLNWNWYSFVWQAGGDVFDKETGECILDQDAGITTAQWLYDLKNTYNVLPEDTMSLTNSEAFKNYFLTGKAAMAFTHISTGNLTLMKDAGINYGLTISLQGPTGNTGFWSSADQYTLMSAAEDKELAWSFIKYVTSGAGAEGAHKMKNAAPCTKDATYYYGNEETREMMETYGPTCARPLTAARRAPEVYDYLWKALQGMMNGQTTPEATMADVTAFANSLDYAAPNN